jgi:hypothetical protein
MCTAELAIRCLELQDLHPPVVTPQAEEDVALGLPSAPLVPTVYYVQVTDFDGSWLATMAKRVVLQTEPPIATTGVPVAMEQCIIQHVLLYSNKHCTLRRQEMICRIRVGWK